MMPSVYDKMEREIEVGGNELSLLEGIDTHYNMSGEYLTVHSNIGTKRETEWGATYDIVATFSYVVRIGRGVPECVFNGSPMNMDWNNVGVFKIETDNGIHIRFEHFKDGESFTDLFLKMALDAFEARRTLLERLEAQRKEDERRGEA